MYDTKCLECGERMESMGTMETYVGYISPKGHDHDDNCKQRLYKCKNGHKLKVSKQNRCPVEGCDWVGKDKCSICHEGNKIKEWPKPYIKK